MNENKHDYLKEKLENDYYEDKKIEYYLEWLKDNEEYLMKEYCENNEDDFSLYCKQVFKDFYNDTKR